MATKKWLLYPGPVISQTDGQEHYITASRLCSLYGVSLKECIVYADPVSPRDWYKSLAERYPGLAVLFPKPDGDYRLPNES